MRNAVAAVDRLEKTQGFCVEGQAIEIFQLLKKASQIVWLNFLQLEMT